MSQRGVFVVVAAALIVGAIDYRFGGWSAVAINIVVIAVLKAPTLLGGD
jgi:hypothetical protein